MGFGKSDQNFGMIASKFTMAMWYTDPFHSLNDPVFKSLSSATKVAIFGKSLLVYLETLSTNY